MARRKTTNRYDTIKIPDGLTKKIDEMEKEVKTIKSGEVKDVKRVPIGFGIEIIKVGVIVDANDDSAIERVAQELAGLETVEDAEQESMTLL